MNASTITKIEVYGPVFGTFGFRIICDGRPEYRERGFRTAEQAKKAGLATLRDNVIQHIPSV